MPALGQFALNYTDRFPIAGASVQFVIPPAPRQIWFQQEPFGLQFPYPFIVLGARVYITKQWPPNVRFPVVIPPWVPPPDIYQQAVPPPQQFSTNDGTIQGVVDGVNTIFTVGVYLHRAQVTVNGVVQTQNWDFAFGGTALIFMPISVPAAGSVITVQGWGNW
jgi:hypothetical protein